MAKRRKTRAEKIRASLRQQSHKPDNKEQFTSPTFSFVKGEFESTQAQTSSLASKLEKQEKMVQTEILGSGFADLRKTFLIASIIFLIEAVLYLAWK